MTRVVTVWMMCHICWCARSSPHHCNGCAHADMASWCWFLIYVAQGWTWKCETCETRIKCLSEVTTLTQAFVTLLSFYYAYTLQNKLHEFAALSQKILSSELQTQNMLTPKHAGFIHTIFLILQSNFLIVYNCPPPKSLLGVQLIGQPRTISWI